MSGGLKPFRLRVFLLLVTADYLAAAALGPTPGSTSALRPCRDCLWLPRCPCARLSLDGEDGGGGGCPVVHDALCCGINPRTEEQLAVDLEVVRTWAGAKQPLRTEMSQRGLGKRYCVTEYLSHELHVLDGIPTDVMHIFLCGLTRYELAWLTDIIIPVATTWDKVNEKARTVRSSSGRKMPFPERPKGDGSRSSVSMTLTAAETMDFALARCEPPPQNAKCFYY